MSIVNEKIDIVFIRHTHEAQEVDEETFFYSRETGGEEDSQGATGSWIFTQGGQAPPRPTASRRVHADAAGYSIVILTLLL